MVIGKIPEMPRGRQDDPDPGADGGHSSRSRLRPSAGSTSRQVSIRGQSQQPGQRAWSSEKTRTAADLPVSQRFCGAAHPGLTRANVIRRQDAQRKTRTGSCRRSSSDRQASVIAQKLPEQRPDESDRRVARLPRRIVNARTTAGPLGVGSRPSPPSRTRTSRPCRDKSASRSTSHRVQVPGWPSASRGCNVWIAGNRFGPSSWMDRRPRHEDPAIGPEERPTRPQGARPTTRSGRPRQPGYPLSAKAIAGPLLGGGKTRWTPTRLVHRERPTVAAPRIEAESQEHRSLPRAGAIADNQPRTSLAEGRAAIRGGRIAAGCRRPARNP